MKLTKERKKIRKKQIEMDKFLISRKEVGRSYKIWAFWWNNYCWVPTLHLKLLDAEIIVMKELNDYKWDLSIDNEKEIEVDMTEKKTFKIIKLTWKQWRNYSSIAKGNPSMAY